MTGAFFCEIFEDEGAAEVPGEDLRADLVGVQCEGDKICVE